MKKEDLVLILKEGFELGSKKEANDILADIDTAIELLMANLEVGDSVSLGKYIKLEKRQKEATTARNPKTGETINIPAKVVVKLKATAPLKRLV